MRREGLEAVLGFGPEWERGAGTEEPGPRNSIGTPCV